MFTKLTLLLLFPALASFSETAFVLHERRDGHPLGFTNTGPAPSDHVLTLQLGLAQGDIKSLESELLAISTPSSPRYGKFLSREEVVAYVAPNQETLSIIDQFLSQNSLIASKLSPAGDILAINVTVEQANTLFGANFERFEDIQTQSVHVRTLEYSLSETLKGHLNFVHPTILFPEPRARVTSVAPVKLARDILPDCANSVTPGCLQAMYGIPSGTAPTQSSNSVGVIGLQSFAQYSDLSSFLTTFRPDVSPDTNFSVVSINSGINPQNVTNPLQSIEANLDTQMTIGLAPGIPTVFYTIGFGTQDPEAAVAEFLLAQDNLPSVITTSYGTIERLISPERATYDCNLFMQLGARGVSVLYASGDLGAGANLCDDPNFQPEYPSGCPYVTSVGSTGGLPETADFLSSGGFPNLWARPSYQDTAVPPYLTKLGDTHAGKFNASGRAFPDISAVGRNIAIVNNGEVVHVNGTSASSPIFASMIALLNEELAAKGKSRLGFLNPLLYSSPSAFNDITTGSSELCNGMESGGFPATEGWDAVTGLGTPDYAKLRAAVGL
ncbi:hypothetical protein V5O48_012863 [Marasmius crinis-equi]|uniref:tripeptidyl-peptidase II n=1 Tax=Marasmius crinis-equi TaxID=585013 RepID=A0ABR3F273_9AGAR